MQEIKRLGLGLRIKINMYFYGDLIQSPNLILGGN